VPLSEIFPVHRLLPEQLRDDERIEVARKFATTRAFERTVDPIYSFVACHLDRMGKVSGILVDFLFLAAIVVTLA